MKKLLLLIVFIAFCNAEDLNMQIFKPLSSTCPKSWLNEMENSVDNLEIVSMQNMRNLKKSIGIPKEIQSCNTSIINDYVFEGNVPSKAIKDFFKDIPKSALGLSLPAYENDKKIKTVFLILEDNSYKVFGKY